MSSKKFEDFSILKMIIRLILCFVIIFLIFGIAVLVLNKTGLIEKVNSIEKIRMLVSEGGAFSSIVFMVLQILQTTILQFPSAVVTMAGVVALGPTKAFILSFISIMVGSVIMFFIGRLAGKRFLNFLLGKEASVRLVNLISDGKYAFFIMMIFPFFPDDILCAVAGVGNMSFRYFILTNLISRLIGVAGCVYFSDSLINFSKNNLLIWIGIGVVVFALIVIVVKNKDKIDKLFDRIRAKKILKK